MDFRGGCSSKCRRTVVALSFVGLACGARSELLPGNVNSTAGGNPPIAHAGTTASSGTASSGTAGISAGTGGASAGTSGTNTGGGGDNAPTAESCRALQVVGDSTHTCALTAAHTVRCWGDNTFGQLGDGTNANRSTPGPEMLSGVKALAASAGLTCAVTLAGRVECWGVTNGLLGKSTAELPLTRSPVTITQGADDIVLSPAAACALTQTGGVRCWGADFDGRSGLEAHSPPDTDALSGVRSLNASPESSIVCAVTTGDTLRCWLYAVGEATLRGPSVDLLDAVQSVSAGSRTCVVTHDARLRCWYGVDFRGHPMHAMLLEGGAGPFNIDSLTNIAAVSASNDGGCLLTTQGGVRCWGAGESGQLGDGSLASRYDITGQDVVSDAGSVLAVTQRSCAITNDGRLYCWGAGRYGELGDGNVKSMQSKPMRIPLCP